MNGKAAESGFSASQQLYKLDKLFENHNSAIVGGVPNGFEALVLGRLLRASKSRHPLVFICRDGQRLADVEAALTFFAPWTNVLQLPAWDCLPYDRVSPSSDASARRIATLSQLSKGQTSTYDGWQPTIILSTPNAILQRVPPRQLMANQVILAKAGGVVETEKLVRWLENNGFDRTPTVRETGEYAVRGGILDLYAPGTDVPIRLDFFGDTLESIRSFDAETQRTIEQKQSVELIPMSEVVLEAETIARFRRQYLELFGADNREDALYQAISDGRRFAGMEHWLPLYHEQLDTVFDYFEGSTIVFDHLAHEATSERHEQIIDHFKARQRALDTSTSDDGGTPYKPVPHETLYLSEQDVTNCLTGFNRADLTPFAEMEREGARIITLDGKQGRSFAAERSAEEINVFDTVVKHVANVQASKQQAVISAWSNGSLERLQQVLAEHGLERSQIISNLTELDGLDSKITAFAVIGLETGFETSTLAVIGEQDILGDRLVRRRGKRRKGSDFLTEVSSLAEGDIVVHVDHGIARFTGLKTIEAVGSPHDCLELRYAGDDRLYLPVENIELLSRYGSNETTVQLDRLGGGAWQAKKSKLKKRLLEMAGQLIEIAAARTLKTADRLLPPQGLYDEFAARFPYEETEDQLNSIDSVLEDLGSGQPMDRLICGDVGFGKTEVALRAAFVAAMSGKQVAVVVPTTLLCRQHYKTFSERFHGLPLKIAQASRLVTSKELTAAKAGAADGTVDIIIGTHALLGKSIEFKRLGLLIIDEEQHFGVKHKERLKELRSDVHVLTLSATPIPRTLQLALTGVRELSLITTAPVDRMAVRTFISPFDGMVVREALLRERYRGGQSFYVCPRLSDIAGRLEFLNEHVPELKVAVAHGQMAPGELEDVMNAFYDGQFDVLLSTTIVESGLDIPTANTLIVHRANMFGLAQLYQLRGRVGRSKTRAYALFTLPVNKTLTDNASRRLKVLQSLDTLGAGFQLASHDLDIRGAGNILGEEQSGHVKEVGYELYQQMLEEAVAQLKEGDATLLDGKWSPQISVGTTVMIPEKYVPDLTLRMGLYRRLAELKEAEDIDAFGAEMIDRFGPLPDEVDHLLKIVFIKSLCLKANVEKVDAGPKGAVVHFRNQTFNNPGGLVTYIGEQGVLAKIRPDQSVFFSRDWPSSDKRLKGTAAIMVRLLKIAEVAPAAA